jgi:hypothetical protein
MKTSEHIVWRQTLAFETTPPTSKANLSADRFPGWVNLAGKKMRLGKTGAEYQAIIDDICTSIKVSANPLAISFRLMNMSHGEYDDPLHTELLKDPELKELLTQQALVEDLTSLTRTQGALLKCLSAAQDLAYNTRLYEHLHDCIRNSQRELRLTHLLYVAQLPTHLIDETINELKLWEPAEKDAVISQATGYSAVQLLAQRPECSYGAHEKLQQTLLVQFPIEGDEALRLTDLWFKRASSREAAVVTPKDRFLLMELYWLIAQEHVFDLAGIHSLLIQYSAELVGFGEITPTKLAKMTHSHAGLLLSKQILGTQDQIDRYLMALDNQELLAESLGADLGL